MTSFRGQPGWMGQLIARLEQMFADISKIRDNGGRLRGTPDTVVGIFPSDAGSVTYDPTTPADWNGAPTDVQDALDEIAARVDNEEDALTAHLVDATDAHDASAISVLDTGANFTGTNVEDVLAELAAAGGHAEDHAARHAEAGADELNVADLGSGAATIGQVPVADGAGGIDWDDQTGGGAHPDLAAHDTLGLATQAELDVVSGVLAGHLADTIDSHDASSISIADAAGDFTADNVEDALQELQADAESHVGAADPHAGYVLESLIDAAGDLYKGSADNTVVRLAAPSTWKFLGSAGVSYNDIIEIGVYASRPAASAANVGRLYCATDRAYTVYLCDSATTWKPLNPRVHIMSWYLDGRRHADTANSQGPVRYLPVLDGVTDETVSLWKPVKCKLHSKVAPTGADLIAQIEFGTTTTPGTDLFAAGDRPTITATAKEGSSVTFADVAIENGSAFELVIDQVGSTLPGDDLSVDLEWIQIDG